MKQLFVVMCVMLILALSGTALAGEIKPAIYVGGGMSLPMGPQLFSDFWKSGFGGSGGIGLQVSPAIEIGGTFGYSKFPFDDDAVLEYFGVSDLELSGVNVDITFSGLDITTLEFLAYGKYIFTVGAEGSKFKPYMLATAGMTKMSTDEMSASVIVTGAIDTSFTESAPKISTTDFTIGFGAGFEYMFSPKAGLWLDGKYMVVLTEGESTAYLPLRAGLKFMFGGK